MPGVIFEGPDGGGKSTMAEAFASAMGLSIMHMGGPPETELEMLDRVRRQITASKYPIIFDRTPLLSELVYGKILRGKSVINPQWIRNLHVFDLLVYCRPSNQTILNHEHIVKPHKVRGHVDAVKERLDLICAYYDKLINEILIEEVIPVVILNRDMSGIEEGVKCVELIYRMVRKTSQG